MADTTTIVMKGRSFPLRTVMIVMAGAEVLFTRAWLETGELVMLAVVRKDDPNHDRVVRQALMTGKPYKVPARAPAVSAWDTGLPPTPSEPGISGEDPTPKDIAIRNGWTEEDLEGAGIGDDWGEGGGRSTVAGLTMSEMALCPPPAEWDRAKQYPWDVLGWRGPSVGWSPPRSMPAKVKEPEPEIEEKPEPERARDDEGKFVGDDPDTPDVDEAWEDGKGPEPGPAADLDDYGTPKELKKAIEVIRGLYSGDEAPSRNKVAYHLRKHELPTVADKEQFEALLVAAKP